jgi:hypothetical protein
MNVDVVVWQEVRILVSLYVIKTYLLSGMSTPTQRFYAAGAGFPPYTRGPIASIYTVGGLHHRYTRVAWLSISGIEVTAESMRRLQKFKVHSVL